MRPEQRSAVTSPQSTSLGESSDGQTTRRALRSACANDFRRPVPHLPPIYPNAPLNNPAAFLARQPKSASKLIAGAVLDNSSVRSQNVTVSQQWLMTAYE
jgi:hypothetical protein